MEDSRHPPSDPIDHHEAIDTLATQLRAPYRLVERIYDSEFARLTAGARLNGYVAIMTVRNVKNIVQSESLVEGPALVRNDGPARDRIAAARRSAAMFDWGRRTALGIRRLFGCT